jgi:Ca-activated chloride channel family protein
MTFAHPWWLLAGAFACAVLIATWRAVDARQRQALEQFVAPQRRAELTQSISGARVLAKRALYFAAVLLAFVALAGPQAGFHWERITRRGNEIIFAVDTSRSMLTPDVKPNRLTRAKLAINDFVGHLNGDAVGLVAFAGTAFLQSPITLDYGAFHDSLDALDTHIIPRGGTDITSAIREAQAAFRGRAGSDKILILVTDGEDLEGDSLAAAKAAAKQDGLKIFTVGVGSPNGDLIPLPADQGGGYLKDSAGQLVKSRLDETALKALATATGGIYVPLGSANQGLDTIYQEALAPLAKHELDSKSQKVYVQRFQWPLGASLALLMASLMLGTRRRRGAPRPAAAAPARERAAPKRFALPALAAMAMLCGLLPLRDAQASASAATAASAYAHGDFTKAAQEYAAAAKKDPGQPLLQFDAGSAAYKAGDFSQAAQAFKASVDAEKSGSAKRLSEQEDAYYNLGNTLYREGQKTEKDNAPETIKNWTQAVKVYDAALQLRADDADSKFNRDLVNRKLEALKKEQQNRSKQDQSKQDQPKQDQPKESPQSQKSGSHSGQSKPQSGEGSKPPPAGQTPSSTGGNPTATAGAKPTPAGGTQPHADRGQGASGATGAPGGPGAQLARATGDQPQAGDDQRQPGGMSRQEARELLDSVKDEEKHAPGVPVARNSQNASVPDDPLKDW